MSPDTPVSVWCKICGLTDAHAAQVVAAAGGDAIGLMFVESSARYVSVDHAADIAAAAACDSVGVFVDPDPALVEEAVKRCNLDILQFHGDEPAAFCRQFGLPYIKVVTLPTADAASGDASADARLVEYGDAWALMFDAVVKGQRGGTGVTFDWSLWPHELSQTTRLILAGGLDADNVARAIQDTQPFGVDASSGIEGARKGVKDADKIKKFIAEVKGVAR